MKKILQSWLDNGQSWIKTIDREQIASRKLATNAAITCAVLAEAGESVIDLGCGEGWLSRYLAEHGWTVSGIDGVPDLIANAKAKAGGPTYYCLSYEDLQIQQPAIRPHDGIVINFALFEAESTLQLLDALRPLVKSGGFLLIQTVALAPDEPLGWKNENWQAMGTPYQTEMPWYYRDAATWETDLAQLKNWSLDRITSSKHPVSGATLSWVIRLEAK